MNPRLVILSGGRAGTVEPLTAAVSSVGRHATCRVRVDGDTSAESFDTSTFGTGEMSASEEASATDWLTNSPGGSATQDWFSSQHGEQAQESELAAEVPDFSASSTKDSEASEEAPSLDWFSTTPEDSSKLAPAEPFDASVFGTSSLDDWSGEQEKEGLPDWLTSTGSIDSTNEAMEPESSVGDPDWLMRVRARQQAEQQFEVLSDEAVSASPKVYEILAKVKAEGYDAYLVLDATVALDRRGRRSSAALPSIRRGSPSGHRGEGEPATFKIDMKDLSLLRSLGIDPTRPGRARRSPPASVTFRSTLAKRG